MSSGAVSQVDWVVGQECYLPFWVLLDYVKSPCRPFAKCTIVHLYDAAGLEGDGRYFQRQMMRVADLLVGPDLVASGIPAIYLIAPADLATWAHRIANWFLKYDGDK